MVITDHLKYATDHHPHESAGIIKLLHTSLSTTPSRRYIKALKTCFLAPTLPMGHGTFYSSTSQDIALMSH
jgi:hypothetical protein